MKSLSEYITEQYKDFRIVDLEVKYLCMPNQTYIKFHLPESYSEDDFIMYIQDLYFDKLPGFDRNAEKYFGKNASKIYDVLFEYDRYEKGVSSGDCVEWNQNIDNSHNIEDEKFNYVQVSGLRYVIKFDEFDLKEEYSTDIYNTLVELFTIPTNNKELPLILKLDEKNITYTE